MAMLPLEFGLSLWRAGLDMAASVDGAGEAMVATGEVLDRRMRLVAEAVRDPSRADVAEFGLMLPEKVDAFTRAGLAAAGELVAWQIELLEAWRRTTALLLAGRLPTPADTAQLWSQSSRMIERAAGAGARSFAPVHRSVTANARRLKRARRG